MKYFKRILAFSCLLVLLAPQSLWSQHFENLNSEFPMGLSEKLFEDAEGFLWIGTSTGLLRYDGYEAISFTHHPNDTTSISGNNINAIGQDRRGRIWVGVSQFGLNILDAEQKSFFHPELYDANGILLEEISVNAIAQRDSAVIWVGTSLGLFQFSSGDHPEMINTFTYQEDDPTSLCNDYVLNAFVDSKGRLWVGTNRGVNLYDQRTNSFINHRSNASFPNRQTVDMAEDAQGRIWLSTRYIEESLMIYDESSGNFVPALHYPNHPKGELKITFSREGELWISSRGVGAYRINLESMEETFFDPNKSENHGYQNINGLGTLTDRAGNIWIGGNKLMKWPASGKGLNSLSTDEKTTICIYANSTSIWYSDTELHMFDRKDQTKRSLFPASVPTNIRKRVNEYSSSKIVYGIQYFDDEHLILATTRNIFKWNTRHHTFIEYPLDMGGPIRDFVITPDKNNLWLCGNQGTPVLFNLRNGTATHPKKLEQVTSPRCVAQDINGDLWFGSGTSGVFYISADTQQLINFKPHHSNPARALDDYFIYDIAIADSLVYVATSLGLQIIDKFNKEVIPVDGQPSLSENSFRCIIEDLSGIIWLGSQQGLLSYDPKNEIIRTFKRDAGLINTIYSEGACFIDKEGILYFGGDRGIDYFDPSAIGINTVPPELYIGKMLINNVALSHNDIVRQQHRLNLDHTKNFIEIELLALHFTSPHSNTYAYRIPEIDTVWRNLGTQRKITLADMQPGRYTLEARAANADGIWSSNKMLLTIKITPAFWSTWWFISLCTLFIIAILVLAYRYHIFQIHTKEKLKSDFNKRVAELESKALRSQMNPHFLFNSLNSVKSLIAQGNNEKATQYITRFGQLIRQILANSEKPFVRLQEELEALRLYLEIEQLRFQNFTYKIIVDDNVNADFIEVPPLILQPYVENAIWHGLMLQTTIDRQLTVRVSRHDLILHLSIEDNGIGRKKAQEIKSLGNSRKGGMGMRLTEDRLNLLKSLYGQEVKIAITDLEINGKSTGTRVDVQIPCVD